MPPQTTSTSAHSHSSNATDLKKDVEILTTAPPPLHSRALVSTLIAIFTHVLPKNIDQVAAISTFTRRILPQYVSIKQLAYIRLAIAACIWLTSILTMLSSGLIQTTSYMKGSKLIMVPNKLTGIKTMFPFTSWSWNLLGASFTLSGYIAWKAATTENGSNIDISPTLLRAALVCWEIAAPFTLLVAAVVRYAIWPAVLKSNSSDTQELKSWRMKMMHNFNVLFALTETALLGGVPIQWDHVSLGPLVGCAYIIFSWNMSCSWNDTAKVGPQFIYFFLDTTLPGFTPSIAIVILLIFLMVFYAVFCSAGWIMDTLDGGVLTRVMFVTVLSAVFMRFRD